MCVPLHITSHMFPFIITKRLYNNHKDCHRISFKKRYNTPRCVFPLRITITELSHRLDNDHKDLYKISFEQQQECFLLSDNDHITYHQFPSIKKYNTVRCGFSYQINDLLQDSFIDDTVNTSL